MKSITSSFNSKPEFFTVSEVAAKLRTSKKTILRRIDDGKIIARKDGGQYLVAPADYFAYVEALPRTGQ